MAHEHAHGLDLLSYAFSAQVPHGCTRQIGDSRPASMSDDKSTSAPPKPEKNREIAGFFELLWSSTFAESWFRWVEWLLLTSALYALGKFADSALLRLMAYVSAAITFWYALHKVETTFSRIAKLTHGLRRRLQIAVALVLIALMMLSYMLVYQALETVFTSGVAV